MDDEPLFVIRPAPVVPAPARSNRVGVWPTITTAVVGLLVGLLVGVAMNHRHGAPATGITATASK